MRNRCFLYLLAILCPNFLVAQTIESLVPEIRPAIFTVFAEDYEGKIFSQGSGFFISSDGIAITNFHVLEGAYSAYIKTYDGNIYKVKHIIDYNPDFDLVKFKIGLSTKNSFLELSSKLPTQGTRIISYSTPKGLENTLSTGDISAIRNFSNYGTVLQITAPISSGSSGSPILNFDKQVVGVSTFNLESGQNLNFAVSYKQIKTLNRDLTLKVEDLVRNQFQTKNVRIAIQLEKKGKREQAIKLLNKELDNSPKNHLALYYRGIFKCREENYLDGLSDLRTACQIQEYSNFDYLMHYATFLRNVVVLQNRKHQQVNPDLLIEIIKILELAVIANPECGSPFSTLAYVIYVCNKKNTSRLNNALKYINIALDLNPNVEDFVIRAEIKTKLNDFVGAVIDCDNAILLNPTYYRAYFIKGDVEFFDLRYYDDGLLNIEKAFAFSAKESPFIRSDILAMRGVIKASKAFFQRGADASILILEAFQDLENAYKIYPNPTYKERMRQIREKLSSYVKSHGSFP